MKLIFITLAALSIVPCSVLSKPSVQNFGLLTAKGRERQNDEPNLGSCKDFAVGNCLVYNEPVQSVTALTIEICQTFCANSQENYCKFFFYDREHRLCSLMGHVDYAQFITSCLALSGPTDVDLQDCLYGSTEACELFHEGSCTFSGNIVAIIPNTESAKLCQDSCRASTRCDHFEYDGTRRCILRKSATRTCTTILGPSAPFYQTCLSTNSTTDPVTEPTLPSDSTTSTSTKMPDTSTESTTITPVSKTSVETTSSETAPTTVEITTTRSEENTTAQEVTSKQPDETTTSSEETTTPSAETTRAPEETSKQPDETTIHPDETSTLFVAKTEAQTKCTPLESSPTPPEPSDPDTTFPDTTTAEKTLIDYEVYDDEFFALRN